MPHCWQCGLPHCWQHGNAATAHLSGGRRLIGAAACGRCPQPGATVRHPQRRSTSAGLNASAACQSERSSPRARIAAISTAEACLIFPCLRMGHIGQRSIGWHKCLYLNNLIAGNMAIRIASKPANACPLFDPRRRRRVEHPPEGRARGDAPRPDTFRTAWRAGPVKGGPQAGRDRRHAQRSKHGEDPPFDGTEAPWHRRASAGRLTRFVRPLPRVPGLVPGGPAGGQPYGKPPTNQEHQQRQHQVRHGVGSSAASWS